MKQFRDEKEIKCIYRPPVISSNTLQMASIGSGVRTPHVNLIKIFFFTFTLLV